MPGPCQGFEFGLGSSQNLFVQAAPCHSYYVRVIESECSMFVSYLQPMGLTGNDLFAPPELESRNSDPCIMSPLLFTIPDVDVLAKPTASECLAYQSPIGQIKQPGHTTQNAWKQQSGTT
jgi:hypothetical protein